MQQHTSHLPAYPPLSSALFDAVCKVLEQGILKGCLGTEPGVQMPEAGKVASGALVCALHPGVARQAARLLDVVVNKSKLPIRPPPRHQVWKAGGIGA